MTHSDEETCFETVNWLNFILQPIKLLKSESKVWNLSFDGGIPSSVIFFFFSLSLQPGDKKSVQTRDENILSPQS